MTSSTNADESLRAHAFASDDGNYLGFSRDPTGADLPVTDGVSRWEHYAAFELAADRSVPADVPPEPILRGFLNPGYYIWRKGFPHATSQ